MTVKDLSYIVVRMHALKTYLIDPAYLKNYIVNATSLEELASYLYGTYYREKLARLEKKVTKNTIMDVIRSVFEERCRMLISSLPYPYSEFVQNYVLRFDIKSLVRILAEKYKEIPHEPIESYRYEFSVLDYASLLKARSIEELLKILPSSFFGDVSKLALELWERYKSLYAVELVLWSTYYRKLIRFLRELPSEEAEFVWRCLGVEVDLMNISIVLGPMKYGFSVDYLDRMLIEKSYRVMVSELRKIYGLEPRLATRVVPEVYREVVEQYLIGADFYAKTLGERIIMKEVLSILPRDPIGFGYVFGILKLFEFEFENLRVVVESIVKGLRKDMIQRMVII